MDTAHPVVAADDGIMTPEALRIQAKRTAIEMVLQQHRDADITTALAGYGVSDADATGLIDGARKEIVTAKRQQAMRGMGIGALWFVGGLVVTGGGYLMASPGGSYMITWGAVIFGGFRIITNAVAYFGAKA